MGDIRVFHREAFARVIRVRLAENQLTSREASKAIGVSHATLSRAAAGKKDPSVETYLRIKRWLKNTAPPALAMEAARLAQAGEGLAAKGNAEEATCYLCAGKCRGHRMGRPEEWEPKPGSRAAVALDRPCGYDCDNPACCSVRCVGPLAAKGAGD